MLIEDSEPTKPLSYTWILQRSASDKPDQVVSKWQFGFFAPDGSDIRVTLHQTDHSTQPEQATFYVTFFCNHSPESFTKWDTSLSQNDSLVVWVTITHAMIDFLQKSKAKIVVFDDLANGKLKMIFRSLSLDMVDADQDYEFEQTKKGHYHTFFQVKKKGVPSAFDDKVARTDQEGETAPPEPPAEETGAPAPEAVPPPADAPEAPLEPKEVAPAPEQDEQSGEENAPETDKDLTIEIGRDYSVTARDQAGHAVDRYQAKDPADILRWIEKKSLSGNKMKVVQKALPSLLDQEDKEQTKADDDPKSKFSECVVAGQTITVHRDLTAQQAAQINELVSAPVVKKTEEGITFEWANNRDMNVREGLLKKMLELMPLVEVLPAA